MNDIFNLAYIMLFLQQTQVLYVLYDLDSKQVEAFNAFTVLVFLIIK